MADVNKTIEIGMQVDLSSFTNQLKRMPNISEASYKEVTKNLQKELRKAQKAAEKSAKVQQKAMQKASKAYDQTAKSARNVRKQSREMGAAFGALEDVVSEVSPELGGAAMAIGTFGQAFRALSRSLATGNPVIVGLIVTVAALASAYHLFTSASREAERQQKLLTEATEAANKKLEAQAGIVDAIGKSQGDASRALQVFTGQMTQLDADIAKLKEGAQDTLTKQLETQDKFIEEQRELLRINDKARKSASSLTEEETKKLELALAANDTYRKQNVLSQTQAGISVILGGFQNVLNQNLQREVTIRNRIVQENQETFDIQKELLQLQEEYRKEQEEEAKREQRRAAARAAARQRDQQLTSAINSITQTRTTLEQEIFNLQNNQKDNSAQIASKYAEQLQALEAQRQTLVANLASNTDLQGIEEQRLEIMRTRDAELAAAVQLQIDQENAKHERQKEQLKTQQDQIFAEYEKAEAIARTSKDRQKLKELETESIRAIADLETKERELELEHIEKVQGIRNNQNAQRMKFEDELAKHRKKLHKEEMQQISAGVQASIKGVQDFATGGMQLLQQTGNDNKQLINVLFRANQAAALADIAMKTAVAISAAPAQYGPAAPAAIALITASAGVQAGVVLSQKPPLHMGGYIAPAPDENQRTVLGGEAVLDRRTVQNIGGENGVNRLLNGQGMQPEIIVMNPFKHLDRYNKSAARRAKPLQYKPNRARY